MGEPVAVTCAQCKAPYAVFGIEPPLEYVCVACTQAPTVTMRDFCAKCGCSKYTPHHEQFCPELADDLGGPPVLSPLKERVAALEQELRAGITRAENDLAEARNVARKLLESFHPVSADLWRLDYPWLTGTD